MQLARIRDPKATDGDLQRLPARVRPLSAETLEQQRRQVQGFIQAARTVGQWKD